MPPTPFRNIIIWMGHLIACLIWIWCEKWNKNGMMNFCQIFIIIIIIWEKRKAWPFHWMEYTRDINIFSFVFFFGYKSAVSTCFHLMSKRRVRTYFHQQYIDCTKTRKKRKENVAEKKGPIYVIAFGVRVHVHSRKFALRDVNVSIRHSYYRSIVFGCQSLNHGLSSLCTLGADAYDKVWSFAGSSTDTFCNISRIGKH